MENQDTIILLVDDDYGHANLVKINFRSKGLTNQVKHFSSELAVLKYLFDGTVNHDHMQYIMLLDINMPGLDSQRILDKLKQHDHTSSMPVVMLTASDDLVNINGYCELGFSSCLSKPLRYQEFEKMLENIGMLITNVKHSCMKKLVSLISG